MPCPRGTRSHLAYDLARRLVVAEHLVARLAELLVPGPLGDPNLGHQLGLRPVGVAGRAAEVERRGRALEPLELVAEQVQRPLVEPGTDLARVAQLAPLVEADEDRAESLPRATRLGPAADHQLLTVGTLELQPVAGTLGDVWAGGALCDHALPALRARVPECGHA